MIAINREVVCARGLHEDGRLARTSGVVARPAASTRSWCCGKLSRVLQFLEFAMPRPLEALAEEVLQLPAEARSKLLDRVVASLDADRRRDEAWDALAARRDAEIESGQDSVVPGPGVLMRLRAELK